MNITKANMILMKFDSDLKIVRGKDYFYFTHPTKTPPNSIYTNSIKNITETDLYMSWLELKNKGE